MVEFLRKFKNHGIKIARVNAILITQFIDLQLFSYFNFVWCWGALGCAVLNRQCSVHLLRSMAY